MVNKLRDYRIKVVGKCCVTKYADHPFTMEQLSADHNRFVYRNKKFCGTKYFIPYTYARIMRVCVYIFIRGYVCSYNRPFVL